MCMYVCGGTKQWIRSDATSGTANKQKKKKKTQTNSRSIDCRERCNCPFSTLCCMFGNYIDSKRWCEREAPVSCVRARVDEIEKCAIRFSRSISFFFLSSFLSKRWDTYRKHNLCITMRSSLPSNTYNGNNDDDWPIDAPPQHAQATQTPRSHFAFEVNPTPNEASRGATDTQQQHTQTERARPTTKPIFVATYQSLGGVNRFGAHGTLLRRSSKLWHVAFAGCE
jgi:hypothetical protein